MVALAGVPPIVPAAGHSMIYDRFGNTAQPREHSECPSCRGELLAKCGKFVTWHWAHVASDCDSWAEPETEWHRGWKKQLEQMGARIEVPMGEHRADIVLPGGGIVELQSRYLNVEDIEKREEFYGADMDWVYRCTWMDRIHYGNQGFWWKNGSKSMTAHKTNVYWDYGGELLWKVNLNLVEKEQTYFNYPPRYHERVLGKVVKRIKNPYNRFADA